MREGAGRPGVAGKREMVRKEGLEPSRPYGHKLLRLTRLPIPPLPHSESPYYSHFAAAGKYRLERMQREGPRASSPSAAVIFHAAPGPDSMGGVRVSGP